MISFKPLKEPISVVKKKSAPMIEMHPINKKFKNGAYEFAYTGFAQTFLAAGFKEVILRSATRPIMRYSVE